eukprot:2345413-Rhodomonas_salina.1
MPAIGLRACYAMSAIGIAHGPLSAYALAMQCPVLRWGIVVPGTFTPEAFNVRALTRQASRRAI